ncbi:Cytochrome c oxidase assembly factor 7 [Mactra antiquata]
MTGEHELLEHYYAKAERDYKFHCNERNDSVACHDLASFYQLRRKDFTKALEIFKENCFKKNYGESCFMYGQLLSNGKKGVVMDMEEGTRAYQHGCNIKKHYSGASCYCAGLLSINEKMNKKVKSVVGPVNVDKALKLFIRGCEVDEKNSCTSAATLLYEREKNSDYKLGYKCAVKACEMNSLAGCRLAAKACKDGLGTEVNEKLFQYFRTRAVALQNVESENRTRRIRTKKNE